MLKEAIKKIDLAIKYNDGINGFLKQGIEEKSDFNTSLNRLISIFKS